MSAQRPGCPGLNTCQVRRSACGHAARVNAWRDIWQAWELQLERENPGMYPTEVAEWREANPPVTFHEYLIATRRPESALA